MKGVGQERVDKEMREEILLEITGERRIMTLKIFFYFYVHNFIE
jgi:hypothetical protein